MKATSKAVPVKIVLDASTNLYRLYGIEKNNIVMIHLTSNVKFIQEGEKSVEFLDDLNNKRFFFDFVWKKHVIEFTEKLKKANEGKSICKCESNFENKYLPKYNSNLGVINLGYFLFDNEREIL